MFEESELSHGHLGPGKISIVFHFIHIYSDALNENRFLENFRKKVTHHPATRDMTRGIK
jgi:hypothetical protein